MSNEHGNRPKRPLTAYNFFFKAERAKILRRDPKYVDERRTGANRPHRKTPGMVGFAGLARHVSEKWKKMSDEEKLPYYVLFQKDKIRYMNESQALKDKWPGMEPMSLNANDYMTKVIPQNALNHAQVFELTYATEVRRLLRTVDLDSVTKVDARWQLEKDARYSQSTEMQVDPIAIEAMTAPLYELESTIRLLLGPDLLLDLSKHQSYRS